MLFYLLNAIIAAANEPSYLTRRTTRQYNTRNVPAWDIDLNSFEQILLAKPENGAKINIVLPDYNAQYQEYEIEQVPLFAYATRKKYPGKLFAFRGNLIGNKEERIGIVYCFQSLKVYYANHEQTIEMDQRLNGITVYDPSRYTRTRSTREQNLTDILQQQHFCHVHREVGSELPDPGVSFNTDFDKFMDDIKIVKFLPFPTQTYSQRLNTGKGLQLTGLSENDLKVNVFSSTALSVLYLNAIYLPILSTRFEMQLDLNMITLEYTSQQARAKYIDLSKNSDFDLDNKVLQYASEFFDLRDIDLGVMFATGASQGLANLKGMTPNNAVRAGCWVTDEFIRFAQFPVILAHEIGHMLGTDHAFTYEFPARGNIMEATEVGSGVTIMSYPGRTIYDNVLRDHIPYFTWTSSKLMINTLLENDQIKTIPKKNRKPIIGNMKNRYFIPTGTAFLLNGTATDPDGDVLYYLWEQTDPFTQVVNYDSFGPNLETGPILRNYAPALESHRFCPRLDRIKAGKLTDQGQFPEAWETVSNVPRTITMAFVVRDRKMVSGEAGNTAVKIVELKVVQSDPFKISSFNEQTSVAQGSLQNVYWTVGNTTSGEIDTKTVTIKFAADGVNFDYVLAQNVPNNGSAQVTMPSVTTTKGRIMIQGDDNIFITINTADITLT